MKNREKYKTRLERKEAFNKWCIRQRDIGWCYDCARNNDLANVGCICFWLEAEVGKDDLGGKDCQELYDEIAENGD